MARKPDIQYVRFYTDGSAARQLEIKPVRRKKFALPKPPKQKKRVVHVDPLALGGIVVSVVMLVLMLVGAAELLDLRSQTRQMEGYVAYLQEQNVSLSNDYEAGYDLESVEKAALALGMIPVEEAKTVTVTLQAPETVEEPSVWQRMSAFFAGLFA